MASKSTLKQVKANPGVRRISQVRPGRKTTTQTPKQAQHGKPGSRLA